MKITYLILFTLIISSCSNDSNPTSTTVINNTYFESPYRGTWDISIRSPSDTAIIRGGGTIIIREDGSFSNNVTYFSSTYVFSGDVQNNGRIENGKILYSDGTQYEGGVTGIFVGNFANGKWRYSSGTSTYATWIGVKQ